MQLALSSLLVLLIILPGILFRYFYRKGFWTCPVYLSHLTNEILYGVIFSIVLHSLFYHVILSKSEYSYDFYILLSLVSGNVDEGNIQFISRNIKDYFFVILRYFTVINISSAALGLAVHSFVRELKLDLKIPFLRFNNEWYYLLRGESWVISDLNELKFLKRLFSNISTINYYLRKIYPEVSVVIEQSGESFLYNGIVEDFNYSKDGLLEKIIMTYSSRRKLSDDGTNRTSTDKTTSKKESRSDDRYYPIEGEYLIINYCDIKTLNINYKFIFDDKEFKALERNIEKMKEADKGHNSK
ncbi:MAG: hypothetical protein PQJ59_04290 [Spirochaetales bacterium]|nr:hypothetical protein [Spirochaetales bacterium]